MVACITLAWTSCSDCKKIFVFIDQNLVWFDTLFKKLLYDEWSSRVFWSFVSLETCVYLIKNSRAPVRIQFFAVFYCRLLLAAYYCQNLKKKIVYAIMQGAYWHFFIVQNNQFKFNLLARDHLARTIQPVGLNILLKLSLGLKMIQTIPLGARSTKRHIITGLFTMDIAIFQRK